MIMIESRRANYVRNPGPVMAPALRYAELSLLPKEFQRRRLGGGGRGREERGLIRGLDHDRTMTSEFSPANYV